MHSLSFQAADAVFFTENLNFTPTASALHFGTTLVLLVGMLWDRNIVCSSKPDLNPGDSSTVSEALESVIRVLGVLEDHLRLVYAHADYATITRLDLFEIVKEIQHICMRCRTLCRPIPTETKDAISKHSAVP